MHKTNEWHNFFGEFNAYTNSIRLKELMDAICLYSDKKKPILEIGSGSGATARIFADMGFSVVASDIDQKVLKSLKKSSYFPDNLLKVEKIDMLDINVKKKSFGVVFHQGLLEHFSDEIIVKTLREQKEAGDWVIFDVPNNRDSEQHYGDERFLDFTHWESLINEAGLHIVDYKGRMMPKWTYLLPHAFFTNKAGIWSWLGKVTGKAYTFICKSNDEK